METQKFQGLLYCQPGRMRRDVHCVKRPRPRVQSAIVALERIGPGPTPEVRSLVHAAFAQRRKTLVNALASAGAEKPAVRAALESRGLSAAARAQELAPEVFPALAQELAWTV